jgi:hypothetical protein
MTPELTTFSTKITKTDPGLQIEMTLADSPETEIALNLVQFRVLLDTHETAAPFVKLQIVTLERVQSLIDGEIRRLKQREVSAR